MITQNFDDVAIIINATDTVPTTEKRVDIQYKGTSKFSVDADGNVVAANLGSLEQTTQHIFYVDGSRADTYTANGTILLPYTTIKAAQDVINVLSAALLDSAAHFELCKFIVKIAPGKYTDNIAISTARYIRYEMQGVEISGTITITQEQLGLTDYYGKIEFFGGYGNRAYRGNCGLISGNITFLKTAYDSLAYDAFIGINITGNVSYGTAAADTHGTWVLCLENSYFASSSKYISAYLAAASEHVLIESYGYNKILSRIAKQDDSATKVTLYDCNNTYFNVVNSTPLENGVIKNCTFNSTTSIVAAKTLSLDANSFKSLAAQTPTLTGMTIAALDGILPNAAGVAVTKTIKKTIGGIGITADFNFVTAANQNEQVIDLGAIIPARARVVDVFLVTDAVFTGATTLVADVGNASGGAQFIASATIYAADAVLALADAGACPVAPNVAATHVYVNATPGANWSNVTAGKVSVYVTYIDVTNL